MKMSESRPYEHMRFNKLVRTRMSPPEWVASSSSYFLHITASGNYYLVSSAGDRMLAYQIAKDGKATRVPITGNATARTVTTDQMIADLGIRFADNADIKETPVDGEPK